MRLAKYLAHAGVASRRGAEVLVRAGRVALAGELVLDPAREVADGERVAVDGHELAGAQQRVVYALNKPAGVVSTARDTHGRPTVVELVPSAGMRLYPVGRLDADSSGLILLTNDGELANRLTHPRYEVPRTYRVRHTGAPLGERELRSLREGIELDDGRTAPARVRRAAPVELEITIHEGRKRQLRRMCQAVGRRVMELERVRFGPLQLGELKAGEHRRLSAAETQRLRASARDPL